MACFLIATLAAPIASFGAIAVGERRASWERPAKSAVLGLVAGALGLDRTDEDAHRALDEQYFYAARSEDFPVRGPGRLMVDYHTAQSPPRARSRRFGTRREEVAVDDLGTILSRREYRADICFTLALWPRGTEVRWSLGALAEALCKPVFTPYAGRKACALMLPMNPQLIEADDPFAAFAARDALVKNEPRIGKFLRERRLDSKPRFVALDAEARSTANVARLEKRRDAVSSRSRWQFGLREEAIVEIEKEEIAP